MQDKVFIDSNILIYAAIKSNFDSRKREIAISLLDDLSYKERSVISTQVLGEIYNTLFYKYKFNRNRIKIKLKVLIKNTIVHNITLDTIEICWNITEKYNYSYYDSLIIASAIENDCKTLYTEDLQNNQIIENSLKVINPFA